MVVVLESTYIGAGDWRDGQWGEID